MGHLPAGFANRRSECAVSTWLKIVNLKKHEKIRILCIVISGYLYSTEIMPKKLNNILIRWTEDAAMPTRAEMKYLISKVDKSYFNQ